MDRVRFLLVCLLGMGPVLAAPPGRLIPPVTGGSPARVPLPGKPVPPFAVAPLRPHVETPIFTGRIILKLKRPATEPLMGELSRVLGVKIISKRKPAPYILVEPHQKRGKVPLDKLNLPIEFIEPEVRMVLLPIVERKVLAVTSRLPPSRVVDVRSVPNDPYFRYQWGLQDGIFGIGLPTARRLTLGAGIMVAILDTGIKQGAPDLRQTKFIAGLNVLGNNAATSDDNGHGTHVCGTIAQSTNNGLGCAGIVPSASILPVKVLDGNGRGSNYTIGVGIRYAVDKGARVLNLSIGGVASRTLKDAIEYAEQKGAVICAAAGNSGKRGITYPAAYPSAISVGATTSTGQRASFSQYGPGLSLVAPGSQILQQTFGQGNKGFGYYYFSGTSMATPHVAGAAAAVLALNPRLGNTQVRRLLRDTARDLGPPGTDDHYGAGLLNVALACQQARPGAAPGLPPQPVPPGPLPEPTPVPAPPALPEPGAGTVASEVLVLFNAERAKAGLPGVALEPRLTAAAVAHAQEMQRRGVLSHTGADGSNPGQRMTRAGYPWRTWGEIIASGQPTPNSVVTAWMNSSGHKAIILGGQFTEVGIAREGPYWCATWAAR